MSVQLMESAFPAGKYSVVDPLLVLPENVWQRIVYDLMGTQGGVQVEYDGQPLFVWSTHSGAGSFPLYAENTFCAHVSTDHGLLCVAPYNFAAEKARPPPGSAEDVVGEAPFAYDAEDGDYPALDDEGNLFHGRTRVITSDDLGDEYQTPPNL